jgi:hypothetical protein
MVRVIAIISALLLVPGCFGFTRTPYLNNDLSEVDLSQEFKTGEACDYFFLGIGPMGDASVLAAAENGGLSRVLIVDRYSGGILIYYERCTIVHGR